MICASNKDGEFGCWSEFFNHNDVYIPDTEVKKVSYQLDKNTSDSILYKLYEDGSLLIAFGMSDYPQIPDNLTSNILDVSSGMWHTCAIKGTSSSFPTSQTSLTPQTPQTPTPPPKSKPSPSPYPLPTSAPTLYPGKLHCWGDNEFGQTETPH